MNQSVHEVAQRVSNAAAAGTTDVTSSAIDMQGFEGVKIYFLFGTITTGAATSCKVQQSSDDGDADAYADLAASSVTVEDDDDNQAVVIDVYRPQERYLKAVIDRATQDAVVDGILAVKYGPKKVPTSDDSATVVGRNVLVSPAEGTA